MFYTIENDILKATFNSKGAELSSLIFENKERMHDKEHDNWKRIAPILFPFVSRFPGAVYECDNNEYIMKGHGFARDFEFDIINKKDDEITFILKDNEDSLKLYPFSFNFIVNYKLEGNRLIQNFKIVNTGNIDMYYMLGGHPGFNLFNSIDDFEIKFPYKENVKAIEVIDDFISDSRVEYLQNQDILKLSKKVFIPDALILEDLKSTYINLTNNKDFDIRVYFPGFKYLALWTNQFEDNNFLCIEPWNGIRTNLVKDIKKMGTIKLCPHLSDEYMIAIEIIK